MVLKRAWYYPSPYHYWQQQRQWVGREYDLDAEGLHLAWTNEGAHLLEQIFGLGSTADIHDSKPDDGFCTIFFSNGLSATATKLGHPRTALTS